MCIRDSTTRAVTLLQSLPRVAGSAVVFTAPRGGKLSNMTLTAVLRRMGRKDVTQHGFRSAFRDWAGETTAFPREVIEHAPVSYTHLDVYKRQG